MKERLQDFNDLQQKMHTWKATNTLHRACKARPQTVWAGNAFQDVDVHAATLPLLHHVLTLEAAGVGTLAITADGSPLWGLAIVCAALSIPEPRLRRGSGIPERQRAAMAA